MKSWNTVREIPGQDVVSIEVVGNLAHHRGSAKGLAKTLHELAGNGRNKVVVNCLQLNHIDPCGLEAIQVGWENARKDGGDLKIVTIGMEGISEAEAESVIATPCGYKEPKPRYFRAKRKKKGVAMEEATPEPEPEPKPKASISHLTPAQLSAITLWSFASRKGIRLYRDPDDACGSFN